MTTEPKHKDRAEELPPSELFVDEELCSVCLKYGFPNVSAFFKYDPESFRLGRNTFRYVPESALDAVKAEAARYKEALEKIAKFGTCIFEGDPAYNHQSMLAREALRPPESPTTKDEK